jgi:predicted outer membrane repeat protein
MDSVFENNTALSSGGGIYNENGDVTIQDVVIRNNRSDTSGGGISNISQLTIGTSTIAGNTTGNLGGGLENQGDGTMEIMKSTISDNVAGLQGGGIWHMGISLTLINSTVSGNQANSTAAITVNSETVLVHTTVTNNWALNSTGMAIGIANNGNLLSKNSIIAGNSPRDCTIWTTLTPNGENLDGDGTCTGFTLTADPQLGSLGNNGGTTKTHALLTGSPAIDAVPLEDCTTIDGSPVNEDQRGESRPKPAGGQCDLGAYEYDPSSPPPPPPPVPFIMRTTTEVNCRIGPHFDHVVVHTFTTGDSATAIGRNEDGSWLAVAALDGSSEEDEPWCWLPDSFVQRPFEPDDLPELEHLPSPDLLVPKETEEPGDTGSTGGSSAP